MPRTPAISPARPHARTPARPGAWSLTELVALLAIGAMLGAFTLVSLRETRRASSQSANLANLRTLGAGYAAYALDANDRFAAFTWRAGQSLSQYGDLNIATDDRQAAADQFVDILRRRSSYFIPRAFGLIPHINYSHVVLIDYMGLSSTSSVVASPGDAPLLRSQRNPEFPCGQPGNPCPESETGRSTYLAYRSSYRLPTAFISPDTLRNTGPIPVTTISAFSSSNHYSYTLGNAPLGGRLLSEIRFPSQKVQLADAAARDSSPKRYLLHNDARIPLLLADGSAGVRRTGDANTGVDPNSGANLLIRYANPDPIFEPPTLRPGLRDDLNGRFLWTRMGLRGIDFDGNPVPWAPD